MKSLEKLCYVIGIVVAVGVGMEVASTTDALGRYGAVEWPDCATRLKSTGCHQNAFSPHTCSGTYKQYDSAVEKGYLRDSDFQNVNYCPSLGCTSQFDYVWSGACTPCN